MDDVVFVVEVSIPGGASTTNDDVRNFQNKLEDGLRGNSIDSSLDRRENSRFVHCSSISVSILSYDNVET